jgi:hypothetical protein
MVAGVNRFEGSSLQAHAWVEYGAGLNVGNLDNTAFTVVLRLGEDPLAADAVLEVSK